MIITMIIIPIMMMIMPTVTEGARVKTLERDWVSRPNQISPLSSAIYV